MKITFYGAAGTVTGSKHLLEVNGMRILLDCGLFQGRRADSYKENRELPFDAASIDLMILSHAHIDHSGNIPNLVKSGFRGDILCTPATYDDEIRYFMLEPDNKNPFGFDNLTYIQTVSESKRLNFERQPCIIISASGMAEFGRVLHHLKNRIEDDRTTVLITGWQAPHTLGRRLVEQDPVVRIFGEEYQRRARVEVLNGFSGHADQDGLINWVGAMKNRPKQTFLVHGESPSPDMLKLKLEAKLKLQNITIPAKGQSFEVRV